MTNDFDDTVLALADAGAADAHANLLRMSNRRSEQPDEDFTEADYAEMRNFPNISAVLQRFAAHIWDDAYDNFYEQLMNGMNPANDNPYAETPSAEVNPWLPEPAADGQHEFRFGSYRCSRCAVYNRPQPENPAFYEPCQGRYAQSGKMRAWAENKWADEKKADTP